MREEFYHFCWNNKGKMVRIHLSNTNVICSIKYASPKYVETDFKIKELRRIKYKDIKKIELLRFEGTSCSQLVIDESCTIKL